MWYISYLLVFALVRCHNVEGKVNLTFIVRNYANPNNLDDRLRKCETFHVFGDYCDPMFQLTVYTMNVYNEKKLSLKREAGPFTNKRTMTEILQASVIERFFPVTVEVDLDIHDHDADEDQRIARFRRQFPVLETGQIDLRMGADVQVEVLVKIDCAADYYGPQCQVYCLPMPGLWNCNQITGARICSKKCEHGSCILTNTSAVCVCATGWTGEFCKMPLDSSVITSMILPELPVNPILGPVATPTYNLDDGSDVDVVPPVFYSSASMLVGKSNKSKYEYESDTVYTYAPIISVGKMDDSDFENGSAAAQNFSSLMAITAVAANATESGKSLRLILLLTAISVTMWIALMVVGGVLCYRRHVKKGGSPYFGSVWTNTSYDTTPGSLRKPHGLGYLKSIHQYENTMYGSTQGTRTPSTLSSTLSNTTRSTPLNGLGNSCSPPPVVTGSKIRFAANTVSTIPLFSDISNNCTKNNQEWQTAEGQYEELGDNIGDYSIWEQDVSCKTPLTSFQSSRTNSGV